MAKIQLPAWAWALIIATGVGGVLYLAYKYFVEPGDIILQQYKAILQDIYIETKNFLDQNKAQGIYGLTAEQQQIIAAKQAAADKLRPEVEKIIEERGQVLWNWVETAIVGIIIAVAAPAVINALRGIISDWRKKQPDASTNIASNYGHAHLIYELVLNEFALTGKLDIASAYAVNIRTIYSSFTEPGINAMVSYYQALIPTLPPNTMAWLVANHMLMYLTYEVNAATGIIGTLWTFFYPPVLPPI